MAEHDPFDRLDDIKAELYRLSDAELQEVIAGERKLRHTVAEKKTRSTSAKPKKTRSETLAGDLASLDAKSAAELLARLLGGKK